MASPLRSSDFHHTGWTQDELAKKEGKSQPWITVRLRFGRFLEFITTVINAQPLPSNLTERRFRSYWERTSGDNERQRFCIYAHGHKRNPVPARAHEVMAVTRRLIEGLLETRDNCPVSIAKAFESQMAVKAARTKLRTGNNPHRTLGHNIIRAYLGQGKPNHTQRVLADAGLRRGGGGGQSPHSATLATGGIATFLRRYHRIPPRHKRPPLGNPQLLRPGNNSLAAATVLMHTQDFRPKYFSDPADWEASPKQNGADRSTPFR
jgi:hypothetical protein